MIEGTHAVLNLLSGRWSVDVLYLLAAGTRRYSEIFYEVGEISKKTLTQTLRALEAHGLVLRRAYAEVPVRVEYSLAPLGWSLTRILHGDVRVVRRPRRGSSSPGGAWSRRPGSGSAP